MGEALRSAARMQETPTERGLVKPCVGLTRPFCRQEKGMAPCILGIFVCLQCEERTREGGKIKGGQTGWRAVATK